MIKIIATNIAENLGKILNSAEDVEVYAYALQALLMGIIPGTLAFLAAFIPFRAFGGGVHFSTFPRCVIVGSFLMLGSAYLASAISLGLYQLTCLYLFALLFTLCSTVRWAPAGTKKNSITK